MTAEEKAKERLEKFKLAKAKADEDKASKNYPKEDIPEFKCCVLNKDQPKIIRLIGNSPLMRDNPTDPLIIKRSICVDDNGNYTTIIFSNDKDHPVNKLWKTIIGKYKFDKENKVRIYDNKGKPSFERFIRNGKDVKDCSNKEKGMLPDTFYLFNCIDKTDDWCKENKHTKLLCWDSTKKEVNGEIREYYTYGIKPSLYNNIFDEQCTALNRMYDQFDVVVKRLKEQLGDSWIQVFSPEEKSKISLAGLDSNKVSMEYLTEEEEAYEKYKLEDIPFVSRPTSASYVLKNFEKLIKSCDLDFDTKLYNEFVEYAEKEKAEWAKKNAENAKKDESAENTSEEIESEDDEVEEETTSTTQSFDTMETVEKSSDELPSEVEENPTRKFQKVAKVAKVAKFDPMSLKSTILPYVDKLTDEERSHIIGVNEDGSVKFDDSTAWCPECNHELSDSINSACPFCGVEFE